MILMYGYNDRDNAIIGRMADVIPPKKEDDTYSYSMTVYDPTNGTAATIQAPVDMFMTLYNVHIETADGIRIVSLFARTPEEAQRLTALNAGECHRFVTTA